MADLDEGCACGHARRDHLHIDGDPRGCSWCSCAAFLAESALAAAIRGDRPGIVPVEPDRRPIVVRAVEPVTDDEVIAVRGMLRTVRWPVVVLDHRWEVIP